MLVAHAGKSLGTKLEISYKTGMRPIEICELKVNDIDLEKKLIYPNVHKHGNPRTIHFDEQLEARLRKHITEHKLNPTDKLFKTTPRTYGNNYREMRNNLAKKLNTPELTKIRLYDFRHYFATALYEKTKDILLVSNQLGHKSLQTTTIYTHLLNFNEEEYTCKTATTIKEATDLLEHGFTYIQEIDGIKLYRKRKKTQTPIFSIQYHA